MVETDKKMTDGREADILFSRTVKAGQRIYYIDVKKNRKGESYLSITESKKMYGGTQEMPQISYEKHKIFLFHEDFGKFSEALQQAMSFIDGNTIDGDTINLDMEF